jgi:hypothetical protein
MLAHIARKQKPRKDHINKSLYIYLILVPRPALADDLIYRHLRDKNAFVAPNTILNTPTL